jgi:PIN domain nuclease of toxin-antitoxin system
MKVLLDTHAFIWWYNEPAKLSLSASALFQNPAATLLLSVASVWEMQIKLQLGKLNFRVPLGDIIDAQLRTNAISVLPIALEHVLALQSLPPAHKDPFDRILVAQASVEGASLLSSDPIFSKYPVKILW